MVHVSFSTSILYSVIRLPRYRHKPVQGHAPTIFSFIAYSFIVFLFFTWWTFPYDPVPISLRYSNDSLDIYLSTVSTARISSPLTAFLRSTVNFLDSFPSMTLLNIIPFYCYYFPIFLESDIPSSSCYNCLVYLFYEEHLLPIFLCLIIIINYKIEYALIFYML